MLEIRQKPLLVVPVCLTFADTAVAGYGASKLGMPYRYIKPKESCTTALGASITIAVIASVDRYLHLARLRCPLLDI